MTVRRLKTYASNQGLVFQYYFVGQRSAVSMPESPVATPTEEYIFDVTSDRKTKVPLRILLPGESVVQWAHDHGRQLTGPERYAAVKMRLFRAFDEVENLLRPGCELTVTADMLEDVLRQLGVD
jgi:hypothetical protein